MTSPLDSNRQRLMEQVLKYWYTIDFLSQADVDMEETLRERETYKNVMKNPRMLTSLYRHDQLSDGESILDKIQQLEQKIELRKQQLEEKSASPGGKKPEPCCHGNITVYIGGIDHSYLSFRIAEQLHCEQPKNPSARKLALACFKITEEGKFIRGSFSISPIVWAVKRIVESTQNSDMYETLDPDVYMRAQEAWEQDDGRALYTYTDLYKLTRDIINDAVSSINADEKEAGIEPTIYYTYNIYRDQNERQIRETNDFRGLSLSFFSADLNAFRKGVETGNWGSNNMWKALIDYVCAPYDDAQGKQKDRKDLSVYALRDLKTSPDARAELRHILSVEQSPWGKWPSKNHPFMMQQAAINIALNNKQPIIAVNGPPGTGKTTLLREIVADAVVKRAFLLAKCNHPDELFIANSFLLGDKKCTYYSLRPDIGKEISKYAIVLASSNNNAVENVSKQLPLVDALDKNLWETEDEELSAVGQLFSLDNAPKEHIARRIFDKEGQPREIVEVPEIYFSDFAENLLRAPCWGLISAPLGKRSNVISFYKKVLTKLKFDYYQQKSADGSRMNKYEEARMKFISQFNVVKLLRKTLSEQAAQAEVKNADEAEEGCDYFTCLSSSLMDDLCSEDTSRRKKAQMSNPYTTQRYDREREKLFHDALVFTKEFIVNSRCCRDNYTLLGQAWGVDTYKNCFNSVSYDARENGLKKCMTPLIQTLQLLVPVISTTFASSGQFFKYVNKMDAIGTVIVDEAGQATPQMALRLFSKATKAVIVGDPNQIEPVVSDELSFLSSTLDKDIGEVYSDKTISVQKVADFLSDYGGMQQDALSSEYNWTGVPLYVHSRCIEPMFSISNQLSYGNTMLQITSTPSDELNQTFCCSTSEWINVEGQSKGPKNHFVQEQGERVLKLLDEAFRINAEKSDSTAVGPDLFIISPFHTVAEEMRLMINSVCEEEKYPYLIKYRDIVESWLIDDNNPHIGTVHTFQGREANEVIFLLGCDENSRSSANWVNKNIVNVAASRAKYRLYVIGDEKVWSACRPIMEMKKIIDVYTGG